MEYAGGHECAAAVPVALPEEMMPPPDGIALGHYVEMAFRIACWDGLAIKRTANDPDALAYGAVFSAVAAGFIFLVTALHKMVTREGATAGTIFWGLLLGLVFVCLYSGLVAIAQIGAAHFIARAFLGGRGTLFGVMRPALLGWWVNCLTPIPVIGLPAAAVAWTAVLMRVLEEVNGIRRVEAFFICVGINGLFLGLVYLLPHS
jgi:hypothetical protein